MQIKGFYIEDDISNIESYGQFFEDVGIQILYKEQLLESPDQYYDVICEYNVDFVIIDNHLEKQGVTYDGFDVLKQIRAQDPTIYILLLTNYSYDDKTANELGEFDQTVSKESFHEQFESIVNRIKRASYRKQTAELMSELETGFQVNQENIDKQLDELKKINQSLDKIIDSK